MPRMLVGLVPALEAVKVLEDRMLDLGLAHPEDPHAVPLELGSDECDIGVGIVETVRRAVERDKPWPAATYSRSAASCSGVILVWFA